MPGQRPDAADLPGDPPLEVRGGADAPQLLWRLAAPQRCVSSAPLGGGLGERGWILNAQVPLGYDRHDPQVHLAEMAAALGCRDAGVGLLTAADVTRFSRGEDGGVTVVATVGLGMVTWAADDDEAWSPWRPGTINLVGFLPVPLSDAALVNAVMTVTEAKAQALVEAGVPGTGTASDAVCLCCPRPNDAPASAVEPFGGPRSSWGARLARAAHRAVAAGIPRPAGPPLSGPAASRAGSRGAPSRRD